MSKILFSVGGATDDIRQEEPSKIITASQITKFVKMADKNWDPQREFAKLGMLGNDEKGNKFIFVLNVKLAKFVSVIQV